MRVRSNIQKFPCMQARDYSYVRTVSQADTPIRVKIKPHACDNNENSRFATDKQRIPLKHIATRPESDISCTFC